MLIPRPVFLFLLYRQSTTNGAASNRCSTNEDKYYPAQKRVITETYCLEDMRLELSPHRGKNDLIKIL